MSPKAASKTITFQKMISCTKNSFDYRCLIKQDLEKFRARELKVVSAIGVI